MRRGRIERLFRRFLERVSELIKENPDKALGKWVVYDPLREEVKIFESRDKALKYIYSDLQDRRYVFMTQIPVKGEEAFYGFSRLLERLLNLDISSEIREAQRGEI